MRSRRRKAYSPLPSVRISGFICTAQKHHVATPVWSWSWTLRRTLLHGLSLRLLRLRTLVLRRYLAEDTFPSLALSAGSLVFDSALFPWALTDCGIARADSPQTLSKSCSDKIALKQCTSLLSSLASLLISPSNAYLESLILPCSQYNQSACGRAFGPEGRMESMSGRVWNADYAFHPFSVLATDKEFDFSRRNVSSPAAGSNVSAVYTPHVEESLINGVLQGRKPTDPRGGSAFSNARMWKAASSVMTMMEISALRELSQFSTYREVKGSKSLADRRQVKEQTKIVALRGWVRNIEDDFDVQFGS